VRVVVSSGSGSDYRERAFEGPGVESFDATEGAVIQSSLEASALGAGPPSRTVGTITAIKGSADCGEQTPGAATVAFTGDTAEGTLASVRLDPVLVQCNADPLGNEVVALGLVPVGSNKAHVKLSLTSDGAVTVDETLPSGSHRYLSTGAATITSTGAHVSADVVEQGVAPPGHRLHVEGDLSCGSHPAG
jgi:hypothetical protein